jgi:integrase
MPRTADPFTIECLDDGRFRFSLTASADLPRSVIASWKRRGFTTLPRELVRYRYPKTEYEAKRGCRALIEFLKGRPGRIPAVEITAGAWLERFTGPGNNPREARILGEGLPYSPATLDLYASAYARYIKDDPLMTVKMRDVEEADVLAFQARLGSREKSGARGGGTIAGTRTYEIALKFVRMAFREYWMENQGWENPFSRIGAPKSRKGKGRDVIWEDEFRRLLEPGVISDPLDRALCAVMYYAGLRRSEIWALKPDDLDWQTPRITIRNAWKRLGTRKAELSDPKWHKIRETPFPRPLQEAVRELWNAQQLDRREFVFCRADGTQPSSNYIARNLPKWIRAAGIDLKGRHIVPHSARHSLASALEANNVPPRYIKDLLGHSTLDTTLDYLHTVDGALRDISRKLDKKQDEKPGENISSFKTG